MNDVVASAAAAPQPDNKEPEFVPTRNPTKCDDFTRSITKISVAQICESEGFQGFHNSALDSLSDIAIRYILELGKASSRCANLAGRSQCSVFDLIQGLEELGSVQGFLGSSDVHRSLSNSSVVREIRKYVDFVESVPFLFNVPKFPVAKERVSMRSFEQLGEVPVGEHIPSWLPAFPAVEKGEVGVEVSKDEMQEKRVAVNDNVVGVGLESNVNPFLVPPLRYEEKEVGLVRPPMWVFHGNHGCVGGGFEPVDGNEGERNALRVIEERNESVKVDGRPAVRFRISNGKDSSSCLSKSLVGQKKIAHFFEIDEEIDWKERRAEEILNGCVEAQTNEEVDIRKRRAEEILKESAETQIGEEADEKKSRAEEILNESIEAVSGVSTEL